MLNSNTHLAQEAQLQLQVQGLLLVALLAQVLACQLLVLQVVGPLLGLQ
jgi:hypothetical protein